jgi:ribonuclease III
MTFRMEPPEHSRPPPARDPAVVALEERLLMSLADPAVALAAITHKSYVNEHRGEGLCDNERLEFLGDAVIDLAVSHRLMERFPDAREGELSKIRAALVDEAALARLARELDLGALLRLGRGEELTGGRQKSSLLADALEAVIAAIYLGGGLAPVLGLVDRFLGEAFERAAAGTLDRDYKTQFQELSQSRLRVVPRYRVVAEHGPDHSKVFDVELELRGEVVGRGAGRSKKDAEQAAAKAALETLQGRNGAASAGVEAPAAEPVQPVPEPLPVAAEGDAAPVHPEPADPEPREAESKREGERDPEPDRERELDLDPIASPVRPERSAAESRGPVPGPKRKRAAAKRPARPKPAPVRAKRKPAVRKAGAAAPKRARKPGKK